RRGTTPRASYATEAAANGDAEGGRDARTDHRRGAAPLPRPGLRRDDDARRRRRGGDGHGGGVLLLPLEGRARHGPLCPHVGGGPPPYPRGSRPLARSEEAPPRRDRREVRAVRRPPLPPRRARAHRHGPEASALA